jgi:carboxypeptidase PM20D1
MRKFFAFIGVGVLVLIVILLINTFQLKPWPYYKAQTLIPLNDSAIKHMSEAISIATISPEDTLRIDTTHFNAFKQFLETSYPLVHQNTTRTIINNYSYVFEWKGTDTTLQPDIFMAHYDVVPVEASAEKLWHAKPFGGEVKDGAIWGRGSVDDKASVISILESAEALIKQGFKPKRTILLCFGHNEESTGVGAKKIVEYLKSKNIQANLVIDEGGEITTEDIKDVNRPVALIGIAEKGYVTFELSVAKTGGHSSTPAKETAIDILAKALYKLRKTQMPSSLTVPTKEFLSRIGGSSNSSLNKMAIANMWLFKPLIISQMSEAPNSNAMLHTTIVPTIIESGVRENVIPTNAKALVNSRIITGETSADVKNFITKAIDDDRVQIKAMGDFNTAPSAITPISSQAFTRVEQAIYKIQDSVIVTPFLMLGATDSRSYRAISNGVVNFVPLIDSKGYHGIDERLPIKDFQRAISFYTILMKDDKN